MKTLSLEARIERSKKVMSEYPEWVRTSSRFQGGGVVRENSDIPSKGTKKVSRPMTQAV